MKIDRAEARRIADLAHLEFDEAALDRMAAEMTKILTYIDQLAEVDLTGFEAAAPKEVTPMREDISHECVDRDVVEGNAPAWKDGFFVVPPVME
jgi:aspartyl-tRNA(Asn)/glutamyl-tRNA(Gln) amidotransferase subunit C